MFVVVAFPITAPPLKVFKAENTLIDDVEKSVEITDPVTLIGRVAVYVVPPGLVVAISLPVKSVATNCPMIPG